MYSWINLVELILCLRVPSLLPLVMNVFVDTGNRLEICIWNKNSKDWFV